MTPQQDDILSQKIIHMASCIADSYKTNVEDVDFEALIFTWNLCVLEHYDPQGAKDFISKNLTSSQDKKTRNVGAKLKEELYPDDLRFITDFQVSMLGDDLNLTVEGIHIDKSMFDLQPQNGKNDSNVIPIH